MCLSIHLSNIPVCTHVFTHVRTQVQIRDERTIPRADHSSEQAYAIHLPTPPRRLASSRDLPPTRYLPSPQSDGRRADLSHAACLQHPCNILRSMCSHAHNIHVAMHTQHTCSMHTQHTCRRHVQYMQHTSSTTRQTRGRHAVYIQRTVAGSCRLCLMAGRPRVRPTAASVSWSTSSQV